MSSTPIKQFSSFSSASFVLELGTMLSVLELNTMFLVGLIDGVATKMFPNKQIYADPEDCPTFAELLPLKRKEQTIKTETRKQRD